jgi:hypothetical protein
MRFLNSIPVILLSLIALSLASAQKPLQDLRNTNPLNDDFAKLAKKQLEKWHVPGIAISVVDGDETWAEVTISLLFTYNAFPLQILKSRGLTICIGLWNI